MTELPQRDCYHIVRRTRPVRWRRIQAIRGADQAPWPARSTVSVATVWFGGCCTGIRTAGSFHLERPPQNDCLKSSGSLPSSAGIFSKAVAGERDAGQAVRARENAPVPSSSRLCRFELRGIVKLATLEFDASWNHG